MIKRVIGIVIFLLFMNAVVRVGLVFFHDQQFNDAVRETALFGAGKPDDTLKLAVLKAAGENQVPLEADFIEISRRSLAGVNDKVIIKTAYALNVQVAPGYVRRFDFTYTTP